MSSSSAVLASTKAARNRPTVLMGERSASSPYRTSEPLKRASCVSVRQCHSGGRIGASLPPCRLAPTKFSYRLATLRDLSGYYSC